MYYRSHPPRPILLISEIRTPRVAKVFVDLLLIERVGLSAPGGWSVESKKIVEKVIRVVNKNDMFFTSPPKDKENIPERKQTSCNHLGFLCRFLNLDLEPRVLQRDLADPQTFEKTFYSVFFGTSQPSNVPAGASRIPDELGHYCKQETYGLQPQHKKCSKLRFRLSKVKRL